MKEKHLEQALLQLQNGDDSSLDEIFRLTSKPLFAQALSILKDPALAEDALQDTYLIIFKNRSYRQGGNAFSWIYTICRNCSLKILKERNQISDIDIEKIPSQALTDNRTNDLLWILLESLDQRSREVVMLKDFSGLKHRQIASLLGMPEGTIRYIYAAAIKEMRKRRKHQ